MSFYMSQDNSEIVKELQVILGFIMQSSRCQF